MQPPPKKPHTTTEKHFLIFLCLLPDGTLVEGQLLALEDVAVNTAGLTGTRSDNGVQTTRLKLALDGALDLAHGSEASRLLLSDGLALLLLGGVGLGLAPAADTLAVVGLVPLPEGGGVDLHDGRAGQGVGAHQLVVRRVVRDTDHAGLAGHALGSPREVAGFQAQGTELAVAATGADQVDALGADTGVGGLAALLEGPI